MITIKDEREIDLMRHAGHVVGLVHQELAKWLKPGLTTEQVSDFSFWWIENDMISGSTILTSSTT